MSNRLPMAHTRRLAERRQVFGQDFGQVCGQHAHQHVMLRSGGMRVGGTADNDPGEAIGGTAQEQPKTQPAANRPRRDAPSPRRNPLDPGSLAEQSDLDQDGRIVPRRR